MDPGTVIGTTDNIPELTSAMTWRSKQELAEIVTSRTKLDPGLSHKAKTKEHVLLIFWKDWQDCLADRFGRREAIPPITLELPKSVFSTL